MLHFKPFDVDYALYSGLKTLCKVGHCTPSRNGPQLRFKKPVITEWGPKAHIVSYDPTRNNNPFFSFIESLWMLAGRADVATPAFYVANIASYSDDGLTLNGAYGQRWRGHFGYDQIPVIVEELKSNPVSRRCVLSMWDGRSDLQNQKSKDLPCNLQVLFDAGLGALDMTVTNRSNDMIWGAYGANVVHFAFLQEYIAALVGIPVGTYYQMSNNLHIYPEFDITNRFVLKSDSSPSGYSLNPGVESLDMDLPDEGSAAEHCRGTEFLGRSVVSDAFFLADLATFFRGDSPSVVNNLAIRYMAYPMRDAYRAFKNKEITQARDIIHEGIDRISAEYSKKHFVLESAFCWLTACDKWLQRREVKA